ncbi:MAG: adenylate/guanylate cyclase domain-containing protein, partial [Steroidobacteraceae bacterium]
MPDDRRIRDRRNRDARRMAAILAADVAGYTRLMSTDDEGTLTTLKARREIFDQLVGEFDGRVFGSVGDSLMAQFQSAVNAVRCAQAIQHAILEANAPLPPADRMQLRIGIDLGDVIEDGGTLYGDGVNVAARLQALAEPGGILVSGAVHAQVKNRLAGRFIDVGPRAVKNITEPVRTYALAAAATAHRGHRLAAFLRHRGVIVAVAYLAASWLGVEAFGRYAPAAAPLWMRAAMITLLAAGFVPAVAYAWRFDARRPVARWARGAVVLGSAVASVAVVASAWQAHFSAVEQSSILRPAPRAQPVIAVAPLRNLTGDARDGWLSEGVANLVRDGLTESKQLIVVSPTRWNAVLRTSATTGASSAPDQAALMTAAARAGIDYVVSGEFLPTPEGLLLTARLSDVRSGVELAAHRVAGLQPQSLLAESPRIVVLAKRALGVPFTQNYESLAADFAVGNMEAYESYLAGVAYFFRFDYRAAKRSLATALELAPRFYMARYRLAHVEAASGDTDGALATLAQIPADAPLSRRERLYVDGAHALFARDGALARQVFSQALAEFPYDIESQYMLALAYYLAYEEDAAIAQYRRMLQQEPQNDRV